MVKPFPQAGRRGDLAQPEIELSRFFTNTARPKAVYQDAEAVAGAGFIINSFEL
jgi:hypothetical protein